MARLTYLLTYLLTYGQKDKTSSTKFSGLTGNDIGIMLFNSPGGSTVQWDAGRDFLPCTACPTWNMKTADDRERFFGNFSFTNHALIIIVIIVNISIYTLNRNILCVIVCR